MGLRACRSHDSGKLWHPEALFLVGLWRGTQSLESDEQGDVEVPGVLFKCHDFHVGAEK
jgi:hypothetical protein